ncbi:unnamed protein product [Lactuca virosa]|uniref:Alpha-1,4 glucan phosphorylase n=1 Tax=Lactuca virosa TaxID=75947 RepID=A0AAU9NLW8_9ASTR|nr:unnamed protein product [Lactuca virosa]
MEFLQGRALTNAIGNLDIQDAYFSALNKLGHELEEITEQEKDMALGNGGLGRLASCFLDSMATLNLPAWGYGLRSLVLGKLPGMMLFPVRFFGRVEVLPTGSFVLRFCSPELSQIITKWLKTDKWVTNLDLLVGLWEFKPDPRYEEAKEFIRSKAFGRYDYNPLLDSLEGNSGYGRGDYFLVGHDFPTYIDIQAKVDEAYKDSSDKTISQYAKEI